MWYRKSGDKDEKVLYKLIHNTVYRKTIENLRNRIDVRFVRNKKKGYLKWTSKPNYTSQKIFDYDLVAIHKNKVTLMLIKSAYVGMGILDLCKILI